MSYWLNSRPTSTVRQTLKVLMSNDFNSAKWDLASRLLLSACLMRIHANSTCKVVLLKPAFRFTSLLPPASSHPSRPATDMKRTGNKPLPATNTNMGFHPFLRRQGQYCLMEFKQDYAAKMSIFNLGIGMRVKINSRGGSNTSQAESSLA